MMEIKIKLLTGGKMPTKGTIGAAGYDCYAREDITVGTEPVLIGLGFAIEIPPGYHAKIFPRSSTGLKTLLRQPNSCGIIDSDYRGEICVGLCNVSDKPYTVEPFERVAQMVIAPVIVPTVTEVTELSDTERGEGGFGSTGTK